MTVPASQILFTIIMFSAIYALLFFAWLTMLKREMRRGPVFGKAEAEEVAA